MEPSPSQLPGPPLAVGRTAEVYAWGEEQVVKLFRAGAPAALADKEAFASRIVAEAGVHAPSVGETVAVAGRPGIVYGRIDGESMLVRLRRRPWQVAGLARTLGRLHATMHRVERLQLPSVAAYLRREIEETGDLTPAVRAAVLARLDGLPAGRAVCHGDFHPDNVILAAGGPVIIDWMTAGHGNPDADVARTVLMIRQGEPPDAGALEIRLIGLLRRRLLAAYLRSYRALRPCPDSAIEAWVPVIAAARLSEGIETERARLIALAEGVVGR
jgi:aminoglycoside phosphotransferase (APT) family kinase protein